VSATAHTRHGGALAQRIEASDRFFAAHAEWLARLCHAMAERFAAGGRLIALAIDPAACSDARHVAVEFVHPVIVGKRALPALALTGDALASLERLVTPDDITIAFGHGVAGATAAARERRCLTIGWGATGAEWELDPGIADPFISQEVVETTYHVLWELVHVFFEHRGLLRGRAPRTRHDAGASSFLYPFLAEAESDLEAVLDDVRGSVLMKAEEVSELRAQTLNENAAVLDAAVHTLRTAFARGGTLLALGNGGSATDAMDVVVDFGSTHPALDLTADPGILTAIANDVGVEAIFARQVIAYGREHDVVLALTTSGNSANVIAALDQARRQGLASLAFVGYDGGRIAAEALADHVVITRSQHIPRIQEAQASAYHTLCRALG
jgi:D-sedoheptulose 7-phosphate isomerase